MSIRLRVAGWHVGQFLIVIGISALLFFFSIWVGNGLWHSIEWDRQVAHLSIPSTPPPTGLSPESLAIYNTAERASRRRAEEARDARSPVVDAEARSQQSRVMVICFLVVPLFAFTTATWVAWKWFGGRAKSRE